MLISGVQKFTILDYPEKISCIVFSPYCCFRCGYCYNSEFVLPEKVKDLEHTFIPENIFFNFLKTRVGFLDGVVVSGGEPTLQKDIKEFITKIKELGFLVKLDTNGSNFETLKDLIDSKLVDFVAMDIKSSFENYQKVSNYIGEGDLIYNIENSIKKIMNSGIDYEFRTTVAKSFISKEDILKIGEIIKGAKKYALQNFRNESMVLNPEFSNSVNFTLDEIEEIANILKDDYNIQKIELRK